MLSKEDLEAFDMYQTEAHTTAVYPPENGLAYLVTGLMAEAGEVAGKVAKVFRGDREVEPEAVAAELGDLLWFIAETSFHLGVPMSQIAENNLQKLADRKARGVLKGNGDNR